MSNKIHGYIVVVILALAGFITMATLKEKKKGDTGKTKKTDNRNLSKEERLKRRFLAAITKPPWATLVRGENIVFSVADYQDPYKSRYSKPASGMKYVAVQVEFLIVRKKEFTVHRMGVRLKGEDGGIYGAPMMVLPPSPILKSGDVEKGESVMGWVVFEIPKDMEAKDTRVRYSMFGHKTPWIAVGAAERKNPKRDDYAKDLEATLTELKKEQL